MRRSLAMLALALLATFSLAPLAGAEGERAGGTLIDGTGRAIGNVQLEQRGGSVMVNVTFQGADVVKPGEHGIHLHAVGKCDGSDFTTAGGHFNPTGRKHGTRSPEGPHAGDLPNLVAGAQGATYQATATGVTLAAGPTSLFDADGTALVIHANPDDHMTDPAGNSGGRVACAVLTLTSPGMPQTGAGGLAPGAERPWLPVAALALLVLAGLTTTAVRRRRAA